MIHVTKGDLFESSAQVLVNAVNTRGVMGKGIAKAFKERFPDMIEEYKMRCADGRLKIGTLWLYKSPAKWVLNFPTKDDWRAKSKLETIEVGLKAFVALVESEKITSVAFPALGCGLGGLDWETQVYPLMNALLSPLKIEIYLYPPESRNDS